MSIKLRPLLASFLFVLGLGLILKGEPVMASSSPPSTASSSSAMTHATEATAIPSIEPEAVVKRLTAKEPLFFLDVREPFEYEEGHVKDATLIPLGSLQSRLNEVPKDKTVIVYCRSGHRSARATALLQENGYKNAINMLGGYQAWHSRIVD